METSYERTILALMYLFEQIIRPYSSSSKCWLSRSRQRAFHTAEVNFEPLSEVMAACTPKRAIHPRKRAHAHCTVCHRGGGQRYRLRPPRGAVNDGEEICAAPRAGQGANQVHTDVAEAVAWNWNVQVPDNLATLTGEAPTGPGSDVSCSPLLDDKPQQN